MADKQRQMATLPVPLHQRIGRARSLAHGSPHRGQAGQFAFAYSSVMDHVKPPEHGEPFVTTRSCNEADGEAGRASHQDWTSEQAEAWHLRCYWSFPEYWAFETQPYIVRLASRHIFFLLTVNRQCPECWHS